MPFTIEYFDILGVAYALRVLLSILHKLPVKERRLALLLIGHPNKPQKSAKAIRPRSALSTTFQANTWVILCPFKGIFNFEEHSNVDKPVCGISNDIRKSLPGNGEVGPQNLLCYSAEMAQRQIFRDGFGNYCG